jgi:hypothetical protein
MASREQFEGLLEDLDQKGWHVVPSVLKTDLLDEICAQLEPALAHRHVIRQRNRVEGNNDGTLHHLIDDHPCFLRLLEKLEIFDSEMRAYFSGNYILNSYGGVINQRDTKAYVHGVHRDIRFSSDDKRFMLNILIMLDDFTLENGATHILSGSHYQNEKPEQDVFIKNSDRATGPRGSVLFFDSRIWHATGQNNSDGKRRALTLTFTSPFFKQQLDYSRLIGFEKVKEFGPYLKQVIGYNSRVPASLNEYYVPASDRFYQRGQDD